MIDPGAYENIVGSDWHARMSSILFKYGFEAGQGSRTANALVTYSGRVEDSNGLIHPIVFAAPMVQFFFYSGGIGLGEPHG